MERSSSGTEETSSFPIFHFFILIYFAKFFLYLFNDSLSVFSTNHYQYFSTISKVYEKEKLMKKRTFFGRCFAAILSGMTVLLSVFLSCGNSIPAMAAFINQGENIPYSKYLPGATYSTHYYTVDGKAAYCIESEKTAVTSGDYGGNTVEYNTAPLLILSLHYGPGGDGYWQMKKFFLEEKGVELTDEQAYLYTHIVANYAYVGANMSATPGQFYKGLSEEIAESSGINDWIRFLARSMAGYRDYTGEQIVDGYAVIYTTSSQNIAVIGKASYSQTTPPEPVFKRGKIAVTKTGPSLSAYEDGNFVWEEKGLTGAEFSVFAADEIKEKDEVLYEKDALVGTIVTGEDGSGFIEDLPMGAYYLTETKAPFGYVLNTEQISAILSEDMEEEGAIISSTSIHDEKKNLKVVLQKSDNETGNPLKGAKFGLYTAEDITLTTGEVLVPAGTLLKEAVSGENGKINFKMDLPLFSYTVKELSAPEGYVISNEEFSINLNDAEETETELKLSHKFTDTPVKGDAIFTKTGESLVAFEDGNFKYEERALSGAEFDLYAKDVFAADGSADEEGNPVRIYEKDAIISHMTSDENGQIIARDLPLGTYYLKETKAPYGMILDANPIEFEISYADQNTPKVLYTDSIVNQRKKLTLNVEKVDANTAYPLTGGKFDLYAKEDIVNCDGDVIVEKDTVIKSATSKEGIIDFELDLPYGAYYIKESEAINGYQKTGEVFNAEFVYDPDVEELPAISICIKNTPTPVPPIEVPPERPKKVLGANYVTEDQMTGEMSPLISNVLTNVFSPDEEAGNDTKSLKIVRAGFFGMSAVVFAFLSALILFVRKRG